MSSQREDRKNKWWFAIHPKQKERASVIVLLVFSSDSARGFFLYTYVLTFYIHTFSTISGSGGGGGGSWRPPLEEKKKRRAGSDRRRDGPGMEDRAVLRTREEGSVEGGGGGGTSDIM